MVGSNTPVFGRVELAVEEEGVATLAAVVPAANVLDTWVRYVRAASGKAVNFLIGLIYQRKEYLATVKNV